MRGESIGPLHKGVPQAARIDERLYQSLSLLDVILTGRTRERNLAAQKLMIAIDQATCARYKRRQRWSQQFAGQLPRFRV